MINPSDLSDFRRDEWVSNHADYVPTRLADGTMPTPMWGLRVSMSLGEQGQPLVLWKFDNMSELHHLPAGGMLQYLGAQLVSNMFANAARLTLPEDSAPWPEWHGDEGDPADFYPHTDEDFQRDDDR